MLVCLPHAGQCRRGRHHSARIRQRQGPARRVAADEFADAPPAQAGVEHACGCPFLSGSQLCSAAQVVNPKELAAALGCSWPVWHWQQQAQERWASSVHSCVAAKLLSCSRHPGAMQLGSLQARMPSTLLCRARVMGHAAMWELVAAGVCLSWCTTKPTINSFLVVWCACFSHAVLIRVT